MKKWYIIFIVVAILFGYGIARSADVPIQWAVATDVTGYKIYMSTDSGLTWFPPKDVGLITSYTYVGVLEDRLVLFKIATYNATGESITHWAGAWYDGRKRLPQFGKNLSIP